MSDLRDTLSVEMSNRGISPVLIGRATEIAALAEMLAYPGPYLLDVICPYQEHVLPMIPSGKTVRDIIKA